MSEEEAKPKEPQEPQELSVVTGLALDHELVKLHSRYSTIIASSEATNDIKKVQIIGGDAKDISNNPPAIVIEKEGDVISKIIVKCPCGRHAELLCEYDQGNDAIGEEITGSNTTSPQATPTAEEATEEETPVEEKVT